MRQNKGFSLVELMIVVAIIGILAAIAIPNFTAMQLKSKRAEVPGNVDAIKTGELAYDAAYDGFITTAAKPTPLTSPSGKQPAAWSVNTTGDGWFELGWSPDGEVRGSYEVPTVDNNATAGAEAFRANGACDVDGDGQTADYTATNSTNTELAAGDESIY